MPSKKTVDDCRKRDQLGIEFLSDMSALDTRDLASTFRRSAVRAHREESGYGRHFDSPVQGAPDAINPEKVLGIFYAEPAHLPDHSSAIQSTY